ncbi:sensor histidine kinase [Asticcacaulis sp. W401b]|uniref:sensor histidine kinase n=1 Tax=Asticcacaulis sp. W401b TaxID=3388666 RepID=UPI0039709478
MVFEPRLRQGLALLALALSAAFIGDAVNRALWANAALGGLVCLILFAYLMSGDRAAATLPPASAPTGHSDPVHVFLDQIPLPLISLAPGGMPQAVNRAARALFETDDAIVRGREALLSALTPPNEPRLDLFGRRYALTLNEVQTEDGAFRLATLTDVQSEIYRVEAATLRDTLQVLGHEIMNSLTPISSLADIARDYLSPMSGEAADHARDALTTLSRRSASLTRFIDAYRALARLPAPQLQPVHPGRLVEDVLSFFTRNPAMADIRFDLEIEAGVPWVALDEAQVGQALINIITNAVEATESNAGLRQVSVRVSHTPHDVVIRIADNGEGIAESVRAGLFMTFTTTKPHGSGTGLNLARQIALAHGGNLGLLDEPSASTVFAFTFPVTG